MVPALPQNPTLTAIQPSKGSGQYCLVVRNLDSRVQQVRTQASPLLTTAESGVGGGFILNIYLFMWLCLVLVLAYGIFSGSAWTL